MRTAFNSYPIDDNPRFTQTTWLSGAGEPYNALGNNFDYYEDINTGLKYQKIDGIYVLIKAPTGNSNFAYAWFISQ